MDRVLLYAWRSNFVFNYCKFFTTMCIILCMFIEQQLVQDQVLEILPMVTEVNSISEELNKYRSFEVVLLSAAARGGSTNGSR